MRPLCLKSEQRQCLRQSNDEIPVPNFLGRSVEKDQEATRPHPPPLIILPTARIPSSGSRSRLKPCWNMAAGAILAMRWRRRRTVERRTWLTPAVVTAMCLSGRLAVCRFKLPDSSLRLLSIHLHLSLPSLFWQSSGLRYSSAEAHQHLHPPTTHTHTKNTYEQSSVSAGDSQNRLIMASLHVRICLIF